VGDGDLSKASTIYKSYKKFQFALPEKNIVRDENKPDHTGFSFMNTNDVTS
jgi:hypothetical protein